MARVDEGAQSDARYQAGPSCGDVTEQLRDAAERQIVSFDPVRHCKLLELRRRQPVPADHPLDQALMGETIDAPAFQVARAGPHDERQIAWAAGIDEPLLQSQSQCL